MAKVDHTTITENGPPDALPEGTDRRWWLLKGDEQAASISGWLRFIRQNQSGREARNLLSARLYGNLSTIGLTSLTYAKVSTTQSVMKDRLTYNLVQSVIDTVTAKMNKNRPKPLFLTSGGDYKVQRRAKKLDKFVQGVFYENNTHKNGGRVFRDAGVFGTGITHVFERYGRVCHERVLPSELVVDELEAFFGDPRQIHRDKDVDRGKLLDLFPDSNQRKLIRLATRSDSERRRSADITDVVPLRASWHLPSGPDAKDGKWVLSLPNGTLQVKDWNKPYFPFAFLHWSDPLWGFWGEGAAERLQGLQYELNKLLWIAQRSFHLAGTFKVLLENTSRIVKEFLNNDIGSCITYTNTPPQFVVPQVLPPEYLTHMWNLVQRGYEQEGVSQLSAAAKKPDGLNSGKALREFNDIESDRFTTLGKNYEDYYLQLARLSVATAKDIYDRKKSYEVKVPSKRFIETIDWKEIDLEEDEYVLQVFPISSLPSDPAGRLQTIQEYIQAGMLSPRIGRRLLDNPDLEQAEDLANAPEEYLHDVIEMVLEDGKYVKLEPYDDTQLAVELGLQYYAYAKANNVEEEKLDKLRQFIEDAKQINAAGQPPALPPGQPAQPQAAPQPPPTSDLVQNVPGPGGK